MIIDLMTAWSNSRGGKGKKATYETKGMRVPVPVSSIVNEVIKAFTEHGVILESKDVFGDDFYYSLEYKKAVELATQEYILRKAKEKE